MPDTERERIRNRVLAEATRHGLEIKQAVKAVADYAPEFVTRYGLTEYRCDRRGLFLVGDPGNGKTVACYLLSWWSGMPVLRAIEIAAVFASEGEHEFWKHARQWRDKPVILDDLGADRPVKNYGNSSPVGDWLRRRYDAWQVGGPATHITTNLSESEMIIRYDKPILDRVYEMCLVVPVTDPSFRRKK